MVATRRTRGNGKYHQLMDFSDLYEGIKRDARLIDLCDKIGLSLRQIKENLFKVTWNLQIPFSRQAYDEIVARIQVVHGHLANITASSTTVKRKVTRLRNTIHTLGKLVERCFPLPLETSAVDPKVTESNEELDISARCSSLPLETSAVDPKVTESNEELDILARCSSLPLETSAVDPKVTESNEELDISARCSSLPLETSAVDPKVTESNEELDILARCSSLPLETSAVEPKVTESNEELDISARTLPGITPFEPFEFAGSQLEPTHAIGTQLKSVELQSRATKFEQKLETVSETLYRFTLNEKPSGVSQSQDTLKIVIKKSSLSKQQEVPLVQQHNQIQENSGSPSASQFEICEHTYQEHGQTISKTPTKVNEELLQSAEVQFKDLPTDAAGTIKINFYASKQTHGPSVDLENIKKRTSTKHTNGNVDGHPPGVFRKTGACFGFKGIEKELKSVSHVMLENVNKSEMVIDDLCKKNSFQVEGQLLTDLDTNHGKIEDVNNAPEEVINFLNNKGSHEPFHIWNDGKDTNTQEMVDESDFDSDCTEFELPSNEEFQPTGKEKVINVNTSSNIQLSKPGGDQNDQNNLSETGNHQDSEITDAWLPLNKCETSNTCESNRIGIQSNDFEKLREESPSSSCHSVLSVEIESKNNSTQQTNKHSTLNLNYLLPLCYQTVTFNEKVNNSSESQFMFFEESSTRDDNDNRSDITSPALLQTGFNESSKQKRNNKYESIQSIKVPESKTISICSNPVDNDLTNHDADETSPSFNINTVKRALFKEQKEDSAQKQMDGIGVSEHTVNQETGLSPFKIPPSPRSTLKKKYTQDFNKTTQLQTDENKGTKKYNKPKNTKKKTYIHFKLVKEKSTKKVHEKDKSGFIMLENRRDQLDKKASDKNLGETDRLSQIDANSEVTKNEGVNSMEICDDQSASLSPIDGIEVTSENREIVIESNTCPNLNPKSIVNVYQALHHTANLTKSNPYLVKIIATYRGKTPIKHFSQSTLDEFSPMNSQDMSQQNDFTPPLSLNSQNSINSFPTTLHHQAQSQQDGPLIISHSQLNNFFTNTQIEEIKQPPTNQIKEVNSIMEIKKIAPCMSFQIDPDNPASMGWTKEELKMFFNVP